VIFKGTNIKDVTLPESAPSTLLLDKHIAFIVSYSKKTDDYVRTLAKCLKFMLYYQILYLFRRCHIYTFIL